MLCDRCHKNKATTTVKQMINGETSVMYLCPSCANLLNSTAFFGPSLLNTKDFFSGMIDFSASQQNISAEQKRCSKCGSALQEIVATGHLGCSDCVDTFRSELIPIIRKIHGNAVHTGKIPQTASEDIKKKHLIDTLKQKLDQAIQAENFEVAAKIRDELHQLQG